MDVDSGSLAELARLYDERFYDEISRNPLNNKPWTQHIALLKSIRPPRCTRRLYRVTDLVKISRLDTSTLDSGDPDSSDVTDYVSVNERLFKAYSKSLEYIPLSYKVWYEYLLDSIEELHVEYKDDPGLYESINERFERSLIYMYGYPALYLLYGSFLQLQPLVTRVRRAYDRALLNLAITQHSLVWDHYLAFVERMDLPILAKKVTSRFVQLKPGHREQFYRLLKRHGDYDGACTVLVSLLNDESFVSEDGKTNIDLWFELCELIRDHSQDIKGTPVEYIIREGIAKYTDQISNLWAILAEVYILRGDLNIARDIYEEALQATTSVQDFGTLFDLYARFLESLIKELVKHKRDPVDVELTIARLENYMATRAMLLADVKLKQNCHNIYNWLNRVSLVKEDPEKVVAVYNEAVKCIDVNHCVGRITDLWVHFANFYIEQDDIKGAESVFQRATNYSFKYIDDLATVWCCWVEMYLKLGDAKNALETARRALDAGNAKDANEVQKRLHRSVKLWCCTLDMEQNFGTIETSRATFDRMVELKIVTPQVCLGFVTYLESLGYHEAAFNAFEKCVALFKWPQAYYLYLPYLVRFINRYQGTRLERARDIFDQCIYSGEDKTCSVPRKFVKYLLYLYAHMEEEFGSIKRCLGILKDATNNTPPEEQLVMIKLYIHKVAQYYGIVYTRQVYNRYLETVPNDIAIDICKMYIDMERGLGEIDRARAIYIYCAQMCDPMVHGDFWNQWKDFEVLHGNQDCFREMLRIKRTVEAQYSRTHYNTEQIT